MANAPAALLGKPALFGGLDGVPDPPAVSSAVNRSNGARTPLTRMTTMRAQSTARPTHTHQRPPEPPQRPPPRAPPSPDPPRPRPVSGRSHGSADDASARPGAAVSSTTAVSRPRPTADLRAILPPLAPRPRSARSS